MLARAPVGHGLQLDEDFEIVGELRVGAVLRASQLRDHRNDLGRLLEQRFELGGQRAPVTE